MINTRHFIIILGGIFLGGDFFFWGGGWPQKFKFAPVRHGDWSYPRYALPPPPPRPSTRLWVAWYTPGGSSVYVRITGACPGGGGQGAWAPP